MNAPGTEAASPPWWIRLVVGKRPLRTLVRAAFLGLFCWIWFTRIWLPLRVQGHSMEPAFHDGEVRLLNALAYQWRKPQRGDVVLVGLVGREALLLKRLVGLPGERVTLIGGVVYIDGEPLDEPYVKTKRAPWNRREVTLRPEEYFIIGDNRENSTLGEVERRRILGKLLF